jgi:hypothetical protein
MSVPQSVAPIDWPAQGIGLNHRVGRAHGQTICVWVIRGTRRNEVLDGNDPLQRWDRHRQACPNRYPVHRPGNFPARRDVARYLTVLAMGALSGFS